MSATGRSVPDTNRGSEPGLRGHGGVRDQISLADEKEDVGASPMAIPWPAKFGNAESLLMRQWPRAPALFGLSGGHESPMAASPTAHFGFRTHREDEPMGNGDALRSYGPQGAHRRFDLFISHAAEDKEAIARPLKEALIKRGWSVWFDEAEITLGDSLPRKLDEGLREARFGVVILSPHFFEKRWPQVELDALVQREVVDGRKVILPVWHEVDEHYVAERSPTLAGKYAVRSAAGLEAVVSQIERAIKRPDQPPPNVKRPDQPTPSHKAAKPLPAGKPIARQKPDEAPPTSGKRPRIPKPVGALLGFVIVAYLGAFFLDNHQLVPVFGGHHKKPINTIVTVPKPMYFSGTVAQPKGTWEFAEAKLGRRIRHHDFSTAVSFLGDCIGQATRNSTGAFDERWLLLADGDVIPYPEVHVARDVHIPLKACPGGHGAIDGPKTIALKVQTGRSQLLLRASSVHATTVGFAVFNRRSRKWDALGLELEARHEFLAHASQANTAVAIAVSCWAPQAPANPPNVPRKPVYALVPLGQKPEPAYEYAIEAVGRGATTACSPSTYGTTARHGQGAHKQEAPPAPTSAAPPVSRPIEAYKPHAHAAPTHTHPGAPNGTLYYEE